MEPKQDIFQRILLSYRNLPAKKQYIEFFTAVLTIPVLLTVIILNVSNLKTKPESAQRQPETKAVVITVPSTQQDSDTQSPSPLPTSKEECKKEVGPIEIVEPKEGETTSENPVVITISKPEDGYCALVWSYRINNGRWSDYDDKSIALYNPPDGEITLNLRVKNVASGQEKQLSRTFTFLGPTHTPTPPLSITPAI